MPREHSEAPIIVSMKVFKRYSRLTYLDDNLKPSEANLDYNYSLNRACVDLKYVPTYNLYPTKVDYYIYPETYTISETNKTYYLGADVRRVGLPTNPRINDTITLVNVFGWGVKILSTCNDLYVGYETFTYLEFKYCGGTWIATKKGSHSYPSTSDRILYVRQVSSKSLMDVAYAPRIIGHGYLNFADIYELYTLGVPVEIDKIIRYSNNTIEFLEVSQVMGPIYNVNIIYEPSAEFINFDVYEVYVNSENVSESVLERLRLRFSPYLKFEMPQVSAMLRDVYVKFINTITNTPDPIYTLDPADTLVEVYNLSKDKLMVVDIDYVLQNYHIIPTASGSIYHNDTLLVKFFGDNIIS